MDELDELSRVSTAEPALITVEELDVVAALRACPLAITDVVVDVVVVAAAAAAAAAADVDATALSLLLLTWPLLPLLPLWLLLLFVDAIVVVAAAESIVDDVDDLCGSSADCAFLFCCWCAREF
jgi:hypothetical protein